MKIESRDHDERSYARYKLKIVKHGGYLIGLGILASP